MTSVARRDDDSGDYSDSPDVDHNNSTNDGGQAESDYGSQGSDSEHSDQDPESQETERRVDDDEDRSNPQYIPKRGTFYEHDDRTAASGEESANTTSETASEKKEGSEPAPERRRARKSEAIDRWSHDKYNETEQVPKSRDELVSIYGYDIRNEDAPPHARRNRRYGRGPNKYTRTWEDEEAYRRQAAAQAPRRPPGPDDFPDLEAAHRPRDSRRARGARPRSKSQPPAAEPAAAANGELRRNAASKARREPPPPPARRDPLPALETLTITAVGNTNSPGQPQRKVNAAVAQQRPVPTEQGKKKPLPQPGARARSPPAQPPAPAPPAEARGGSKRYSSLRQRPLAEAYSPQQQQQQTQQQTQQQQSQQQQTQQQQTQQQQTQQQQTQQQQTQTQPQATQPHRYHNEYPGNAPSQHQSSPAPMHPQQMMQQAHRTANQPPHQNLPPAPHTQQVSQVRLGMLEPAHAHRGLHALPAAHALVSAGMPQPQGYAPPAMMPAQYMQQGGNAAVYGGGMYAPPPAPYAHAPIYPHHNYQVAQVPQATQAGGVTYYSPVEQEPPPPAPRPRRPTAAIPIVRPDRPANSSEKDNIDRIVENMFVRKPWPTTQHGIDGSKEKNDGRSSQEAQSKESSQPNSLTSSSISTDSKPSEKERETDPEAKEEDRKPESKVESVPESISMDA